MAVFSTNQVRQMYVANNGYSADGTNTGTITKVVKTPEDELYFLYKGALNVLKSDFIPLKNITSAQVIDATKNGYTLKGAEVTLKSTINGGSPVAGQDYILGINFKNFFSSGDASQYYKDAVVHVTSGMSASDFYKAMVKALNLAFCREDSATRYGNPYLKFAVRTSSNTVVEEGGSSFTAATATSIVVIEKEQEWIRGTMPQRRIMFDVLPSTIYTGGDDLVWGDVSAANLTAHLSTVGNGKSIADLEWFCLGERGDQYRLKGWPNVIHTEYLVDPDEKYDIIEIHYAFTDTGVNSYRTEKELTIVAPYTSTGANNAAKHAKINSIITAINTAAGTTLLTAFS